MHRLQECAGGEDTMSRRIANVVREGEVHQLPSNATVFEAACLMKAKSCGAVAIARAGRLEGIFTERDLVNRVVAGGLDPARTRLDKVMTRDPDSVRADTPVAQALRLMEDGGYRHLPVVEGGRLVGMVSRRDFFGEEKAQLEHERALWEQVG
jgi:CBS domain-containing protein